MSFGRKGLTGGDEPRRPPSVLADDAHDSLSAIFRRLIATTGPISLMHYMGEANARYYAARDPLGAPAPGQDDSSHDTGRDDRGGDFVTAPEISQMFGELVGLWLADVWVRAGAPGNPLYVELGPGRGTLARDALRAAARFGLTPAVHLVEASPVLRKTQAQHLPGAVWHDDLSTVPGDGSILLVANEFLDALPIRQLVRTMDGWRERMVGLASGGDGGDRFVPVAGIQAMDGVVPEARRTAVVDTILETCPGAATMLFEIGGRLAKQGGTALIVDYGHAEPRSGSTLQAVRAHRPVDPFAAPGEADLTAHVDFAMAALIAQSRGARWLGTVPQGAWLEALGIDARARTLAAAAPDQAPAIAAARDRLVAADQMGTLFKVMGLAHPDWPVGAGFEETGA